MQISICSLRWPTTEALSAHINACLKPLVLHFGDQINFIAIKLTDINGPRGCNDKLCRLHAQIKNHPSVNSEGRHMDLYAAIAAAACRLERTLGSVLEPSRLRNPNSRLSARTKKQFTSQVSTDNQEEA